jgi:sugar lactone lactonase YvrE
MKASTRSLSLVLVMLSALAACGDDTATGGSAPGGGNTGGTPSAGGNDNNGGNGAGPEGGAPEGGNGSGGVAECVGLVAGPIEPILATDEFVGSEDIAFDGAGNIWGKDGNAVLRVDADENQTATAQVPGQSYGLRFGSNGSLFVARPGEGTIVEVIDDVVTDFATGLEGPNGIYPDFDGNIWVTEFNGGRVIKLDSAGESTTILSGLSQPNGIVLDVERDVLFFSEYSAGRVMRVDPAGATAPVEVADIPGTAIDGLVLDSCGNVYAVDNANGRLYRLILTVGGDLSGEPELVATIPPITPGDPQVANAQFGSGEGWNATSLYVAGNEGVVWEVPVGVGGAPVPTVP